MVGDENGRSAFGNLQIHRREPVVATAKEPDEPVQAVYPANPPIHFICRQAEMVEPEDKQTEPGCHKQEYEEIVMHKPIYNSSFGFQIRQFLFNLKHRYFLPLFHF